LPEINSEDEFQSSVLQEVEYFSLLFLVPWNIPFGKFKENVNGVLET
jgi:hypothetical protein